MKPFDPRCVGVRRRLTMAALLATLALGMPAACGVSSAVAESAHTTSGTIARTAALDRVVPAAMRQAQVPGAIVGVWQEGRRPYLRAFGVADTRTGAPMRTDLNVRVGSLTKSFTVQAILQLVQDGRIGLDDPIGKYVSGVPKGRVITLRQLAEKQLSYNKASGDAARDKLGDEREQELMQHLLRFPEAVANAADSRSPQVLVNALRELAASFHSYYNAVPILVEDDATRAGRLYLCTAVKQVLANGLKLLGVSAPEQM